MGKAVIQEIMRVSVAGRDQANKTTWRTSAMPQGKQIEAFPFH